MAFKIHTVGRAGVHGTEYLPAGAIIPKIGLALKMTGGKLAVAGGTDKPAYICQLEKDSALADGEIIPVERVSAETIYATKNQAAFTSVKVGDKVTLHTDGMQVTATNASGVAEVVGIHGTEVGSTILVRF